MTTTDLIKWFAEINQSMLASAGGKGANLGELAQVGIPVPPGFVVTTSAYNTFVAANRIQEQIIDIVAHTRVEEPASFEVASQKIRDLFMRSVIPDHLATEITSAYEQLVQANSNAVAVRSSATAEDLPTASFAGQQDTYLNIQGNMALLEAVKKCWASLWTARAISYRARQNIDPTIVSLAVVVQALIPAEAAGILFTANPINGRRDQMLISAAWGLGEAVVGGMVTPDTFIVDKSNCTIITREIADKQTMTVRVAGGTEEQPVSAELRQSPAIEDAQAVKLSQFGIDIEAHYQMPMDIEWAIRDGQIAILQARPITALPEPSADPPTDWSVPDDGTIYMRASITEQLPDPLSPLFATLSREPMNITIRDLLKILDIKGLDAISDSFGFDVINGYVYISFNISVLSFLWLYIRTIPELGKIFRNAPVVWCDMFRPRYLKSINDWQTELPHDMAAVELLAGVQELLYRGIELYTGVQVVMPLATVSEISFNGFYNRLVKREGDVPAQVFLIGFDSQPILADKSLYDLAMWSREQPALAEYLIQTPADQIADLMEREQSPLGLANEAWQSWLTQFNDHLEQFGNAIYYLDFINAVPADAPAPLIETLKFYMSGQGTSPYQRQQETIERRERETEATLARLGLVRRAIFRKLLTWAQKSAPPREDALAAVGLGWPLLRRMLRELGRRLVGGGAIAQRDDVFWLEAAEVSQAAEALDAGQTQLDDLSNLVAERKMLWRGRARVAPPQALPEDSWLAKRFEGMMPAVSTEQTGAVIKGIAVGEGKITAAARVLSGPEDFGEMQPGEVLVAGITTPAWTPLFSMAAAIVTDIGGPLSHSSIVAREYGIPAVLGTGVATKRIQSGQMITVDGDAGTVTLLDETNAASAR